jgi:RES domain
MGLAVVERHMKAIKRPVSPPVPPLPPLDIARRTPAVHILKPGVLVHRFFTQPYDPVYFDRSDRGRFNAPDGSYGVLYAAEAVAGAFAETFLRTPGRTVLPHDLLAAKGYVRFKVKRPVRLIRFAGPGLARVGATAEVSHRSQPYDVPQAWSKALHDHPAMADGIAYTARHDDEALCIALFDRASDVLTEVERRPDLDQDWFWELAELYGIGIPPP